MYCRLLGMLIVLCITGTHADAQLLNAHVPSSRLIIFLHGILGSAKGTFTSVEDGKEVYWPELMHNDDVFERADIYSYEYSTSVDVDSARINDIVDQMAVELDQVVNVRNYDSVLFVAHSLGGIVVRKYLLEQSRLNDQGVLGDDRVKGIFLFGTPMDGSAVANLGSAIFNSKTLWQLGQSDDPDTFLSTLRHEWIKAGLGKAINSDCAYETAGVVSFLFWSKKVVKPRSAEPLCNTGFTGIPDRDHQEIVKPDGVTAYPHLLLREWYQGIFESRKIGSSEVVIASCHIDQFGNYHLEGFSSKLFDLSTSHHVSLRLPKDWTSDAISLMWRGDEPKVVAIHYSCFEDRNTEEPYVIKNGGQDFNKFLTEMASTNVKVISYSRVFDGYPSFIEDMITRANRKAMVDTGRLILLPLKRGRPVGAEQFEKFGNLVSDAIGD